jgi:hypothetical protein
MRRLKSYNGHSNDHFQHLKVLDSNRMYMSRRLDSCQSIGPSKAPTDITIFVGDAMVTALRLLCRAVPYCFESIKLL